MKLLTFYSDSHKDLYETFFLDSFNKYLKNSFNLKAKHIDQLSPSGDYGSEGFADTMFEKINHVIDNIDLNDNEPMVFADCDIQFFEDFSETIKADLGDNNIMFQDDVACVCAGFFVCRQNQLVLDFFNDVRNTLDTTRERKIDDQQVINQFLSANKYPNHKIGKLSRDKYFTVAASNLGPRRWVGAEFNIPEQILVHHGNWTVGLENKFKIMNYVKDIVEKRKETV